MTETCWGRKVLLDRCPAYLASVDRLGTASLTGHLVDEPPAPMPVDRMALMAFQARAPGFKDIAASAAAVVENGKD